MKRGKIDNRFHLDGRRRFNAEKRHVLANSLRDIHAFKGDHYASSKTAVGTRVVELTSDCDVQSPSYFNNLRSRPTVALHRRLCRDCSRCSTDSMHPLASSGMWHLFHETTTRESPSHEGTRISPFQFAVVGALVLDEFACTPSCTRLFRFVAYVLSIFTTDLLSITRYGGTTHTGSPSFGIR